MPYGDLYEDEDIFDHMPINLDPATDRSVDLIYLRNTSSSRVVFDTPPVPVPTASGLYSVPTMLCAPVGTHTLVYCSFQQIVQTPTRLQAVVRRKVCCIIQDCLQAIGLPYLPKRL